MFLLPQRMPKVLRQVRTFSLHVRGHVRSNRGHYPSALPRFPHPPTPYFAPRENPREPLLLPPPRPPHLFTAFPTNCYILGRENRLPCLIRSKSALLSQNVRFSRYKMGRQWNKSGRFRTFSSCLAQNEFSLTSRPFPREENALPTPRLAAFAPAPNPIFSRRQIPFQPAAEPETILAAGPSHLSAIGRSRISNLESRIPSPKVCPAPSDNGW